MPTPPPSPHRSLGPFATSLLIAGCLILPALSLAGLAPPTAAVRAGQASLDEEVSAPEAHCAPRLERALSSQAVEAGTSLKVDLRYHYRCEEGKRRVFFMIVVENTESFGGSGFFGRQRAENVRTGLQDFVEQMDFDAGSRGGLILYAANATLHTALRGGSGAKQALKNAVGSINAVGGNAFGADDAVALAAQELASAPAGEDADRVILLLDSGAALETDGQAVKDACAAATAQGIRMAVMGLEATESRLQDCADKRLYRGSGRGNAEDAPERLEQLGDGLARAHQIVLTQYTELLGQHFAYVAGSGSPVEPEVFAGELFWQFEKPPPAEGYALSYRLRPLNDVSNEVVNLTQESTLDLGYADTSLVSLKLSLPEICVHSPNSPRFCDDFILTLTPPRPTDTPAPTPTLTPTSDQPTATETPPEPSATAPPPTPELQPAIYLPLNLANASPEILAAPLLDPGCWSG